MATKPTKAKKISQSPEELAAEKALTAFNEKHKGKDLTEAQKAEKKALAEALGKLKFVRIANKRIPAVIKALRALRNLSGKVYVKTPAQVQAIVTALTAEVQAVSDALSGTKQTGTGFQLPGFDEVKEGSDKK